MALEMARVVSEETEISSGSSAAGGERDKV
jgi:hypothetical protein